MDTDLTDIHTHILPGLDDGAGDLNQAVAMAVIAAQDGIKTLVATPHVMRGAFDNHHEEILKKVQELNLCLQVQRIKLTILPGAEYYLDLDLLERLAAGELLTINNTGCYLLVEFPSAVIPKKVGDILQAILSKGITPIIAHPERNQELAKYPGMMGSLIARGARAQVTSGSIMGIYGKEAQEAAHQMIEMGFAHIVASDAHSDRTRAPLMSAAFTEIEKRWGTELAMKLFCRNPWRVIRGLPVAAIPPLAQTKSFSEKINVNSKLMIKRLRTPWGQAPTR